MRTIKAQSQAAIRRSGRLLLAKIEKDKVDIREIMAYAVKTDQLEQRTANDMSLDDFRLWICENGLVLNDNE